ncbi:MAG TPA: sugar transferase [Chloroflexi bacterium]|nr:sugar transferase [Chloroflexota bacterium]
MAYNLMAGLFAGRSVSSSLFTTLRLRISERRLLLIALDLTIISFALWLALTTQPALAWRPVMTPLYLRWFVTLVGVWLAVAFIFDLYDLPQAAHPRRAVQSVLGAGLMTVIVYALIPWLTPPLLSRFLIVVFAASALIGLGLWRFTYARLFTQPWTKQRLLIVGAGRAGVELAHNLSHAGGVPNPYRGSGYELVGFVDDNPALQEQTVAGAPVRGDHTVLTTLVNTLQIDEVVVAITNRHAIRAELLEALVTCAERGCRVTTMSALTERVLGRVPVLYIGHNLEEAFPVQDDVGVRLNAILKRVIDLAVALMGLAVLGGLLPWVALANRIASPGPLFYRQVRVGRGGRCFTIYKLRSMTPDAEAATGAVWAAVGDSRVTPVGRWLRRTRLDELPQVINVLRGEMSIIGPRPERPEFVERLTREIPFYRARHGVRPGLTGWAQVQYEYGRTIEDARIKLEYDLYYVRHASLLLDLQILFRTVAIALQMKGA